ncbi:relaxase/mobilization nuclease domain-containing protein [Sphingobacterium sp. JB170]|uniref:relaxase/mobilization nuclease domain-containing protein n=1 Tax=Sphingobacterium sp. JB170 TaxID=1434842 RepID=UPI00097EAEB7|nr:relaxase/mobilization nuclease domain-containing protein [Sphingobacterium sp. JB170]SJN18720.1 Mobilization protein BmgA [Sphingobacterium sp. JB170]
MIGKCKAVGGSAAGMEYLFQDKQDQSKTRGYELDRNMLTGENASEIMSELKEWNKDNARNLKNEVFSMVYSPAGNDGKKLTNEQLTQLGKEFMSKTLGIDPNTQPYYMRVHDDTRNKHVHIYTPRTDLNGQTISDKHCQYRAMSSADEIAQTHDLIRAKEIMQHRIENANEVKHLLKKEVTKVLSNSTSWNDFKKKASTKGIDIVETVNKQGAVQGYRIKFDNQDFKASDIDRKITLPKLDAIFQNNIIENARTINRSKGIGY